MPYLEISRQNFFSNYQAIFQTIAPNNPEKIAIVLKDNAYGHGILQIAELAHIAKIPTAFVKNTKEALSIAHLFRDITILYPNSLPDEKSLQIALKTPNIHFCVSSLEALQTYPSATSIELKVNSGMHRNGISADDLTQAFKIIQKRNLRLKGIFTHNGYGDVLSSAFYTQNEEFLAIKKESLRLCTHHNIPRPRFHSLSSSGAIRTNPLNANLPEVLQDDLFRIGIAFYGYDCSSLKYPRLRPIAALYANKISSLCLKKGASIGYNGVSTLQEDTVVSSYDIGYGDGLFRLREGMELHSAEGFKIFPQVSMDCISIQSNAQKVCIFNDVSAFAKAFQTIPYEILVHLQPHIPRIVV